MPPFMGMLPRGFETEIIYSFVIIICSLMIYFGTRELYELSSYKGIKYLRESFLFFAIAYFFRSFIKIFFILTTPTRTGMMGFPPAVFQIASLMIFIYFSSLAVFYLIYSLMWKKWNGNERKIYIFHAIALLIAGVSIAFNSARIYLFINLAILLVILSVTLGAYKESKPKKRKHNMYLVYLLLFVFWILNIIDILIPNALNSFQIFIYLISSGIFLTILYKVLKKSGS